MNKVDKDSSRRHTDYRMTSSTQATGVAYWIWCWLRWIILENDIVEFVMSVGRHVSSKLTLLGEGHRQCRDGRALQSRSWGQTSGGGEEKKTMYWMKLNVYNYLWCPMIRCQILFVFPSVFIGGYVSKTRSGIRWSHYRTQVASTNLSSAFGWYTALGRRFILEWSVGIQNVRFAMSNFGDILSLDGWLGLSITAIWLLALQHQRPPFLGATSVGPNQIAVYT